MSGNNSASQVMLLLNSQNQKREYALCVKTQGIFSFICSCLLRDSTLV